MTAASRVAIHYNRLPDRTTVFDQIVVEEEDDCVVTFLPSADVREAMRIEDRVVLEPAASIVWFTFPGRWHDIGRFHLADGTFTGYYANILTPVEMDGPRWRTTDLFLDVWTDDRHPPITLDRNELEHAMRQGWISEATAARAEAEAARIVSEAQTGAWPPAVAREWTLTRVCRKLTHPR